MAVGQEAATNSAAPSEELMLLRRVIYVSQASQALVETDLRHIVGVTDVLYRRHDLSGVLAYTGRNFAQVVEGAIADVERLLEHVRGDPRFGEMHVLSDETVVLRLFDRWYSLHVDSPELLSRIDASIASARYAPAQGYDLTNRLVRQLRADNRMR